jgi:hypothetical protein
LFSSTTWYYTILDRILRPEINMSTFDLSSIPAMQPPPGMESNFDNPETMYPIVLGVAIATMTLMTIVVAIRIFTKAFIMRDMRIEECKAASC